MKFLLTMNQIAYFKPETTARRLKHYYYHGEGNPVIFLGYLRLIRLLPEIATRAKPLQPALYRREVRQIYLDTPWEQAGNPWLALFLREFREFFSAEEWQQLKIRYQAVHPFLGKLTANWLATTEKQLILALFMHARALMLENWQIPPIKLRC